MDSASVGSIRFLQSSEHPAFRGWRTGGGGDDDARSGADRRPVAAAGRMRFDDEDRLGSSDSYFTRSRGGDADRPGGSSFRGPGTRKVLPPLPDMDTQMSLSAKMIDRRTSTPKGNHSYGPFFLEHTLLAEYNLLRNQKLPGVYVIPSKRSPLCWFGVMFVRQGLYQEGVFRFRIVIPENYPDGDCPRLFFDHSVFHPLVSPQPPYELDVRRGPLKKWRRNINHIWQMLLCARKSFYKIDAQDPINLEAAHLFDDGSGGKSFKDRVRRCVTEWENRAFMPPPTDDPHYITFSPYEAELHEPVRQAMLDDGRNVEWEEELAKARNCQSLNAQQHLESSTHSYRSGHSFLRPGSLQLFSKESNSASLTHP